MFCAVFRVYTHMTFVYDHWKVFRLRNQLKCGFSPDNELDLHMFH